MKPIVTLYIKMLRDTGYTTIKQCKNRITKDDLRFYRIIPEQHRWKHVHQALEHIKKTDNRRSLQLKTSLASGLPIHLAIASRPEAEHELPALLSEQVCTQSDN